MNPFHAGGFAGPTLKRVAGINKELDRYVESIKPLVSMQIGPFPTPALHNYITHTMIRQNTSSVSAARRRLTHTDQLAGNYRAAARSSFKCKTASVVKCDELAMFRRPSRVRPLGGVAMQLGQIKFIGFLSGGRTFWQTDRPH